MSTSHWEIEAGLQWKHDWHTFPDIALQICFSEGIIYWFSKQYSPNSHFPFLQKPSISVISPPELKEKVPLVSRFVSLSYLI